MAMKIKVSGLTYCLLREKCGDVLIPDKFLHNQMRVAEQMKLPVGRVKLEHDFLIDIDFEVNDGGKGIGIFLHKKHLDKMCAFVEGCREFASKMEALNMFFELYNIYEYDFDSAYRYIKSRKVEKINIKHSHNELIVIPQIVHIVSSVKLLNKVAEKQKIEKSKIKKLTTKKSEYKLSYLISFMLYEYSKLTHEHISKILKKERSTITYQINKAKKLFYTDENFKQEVLTILEDLI